ncbi:MAG: NAD-dependent dehydratase [Candidatus Methanomethylicota archaeon]|uniref:NAD-dependent dehydratase n=1 Tax=Thermoproteota archaeon TaxID=2056631 RepID=A0A497EVV1_9CREN|nr:MAG: NAD-dependent dehydratase [Candidatus Verstraetearchaeota archaeon]
MGFYEGKNVLVTGGASFIGSHLVDKLVELGANVTVVDNLSSGKIENLAKSWDKIKFIKEDLEYIRLDDLIRIFKGHEVVFHLAAVHGGRGYIHTHPADVCSNFAIDHHVYEASYLAGADRVIFASSACVYPPKLQSQVGSDYKLKEDDTNPFKLEDYLSADIEYGWAKLMGEVQLIAFIKQYGLKGCSVRFVTAYGPRENETHAIIALIYKAFERMDPYVIWGTGEQDRDFTYVEDIVEGTLLAGEKVTDGTPINLGTGRRYKIKEVAEKIFEIMNWRPKKIVFDTSKPVGVVSRALDITRAKQLLGWEPRFTLEEGLKRTIEWYVATHERRGYVDERVLLERH